MDKFVIKANDLNPGTNISLGESVIYPTCKTIGCISNASKLKPRFMYNVSNDRCLYNNTNSYIDSTSLDGIITYSIDPSTTNLTSCSSNQNTMYSSITGRFIRITNNNQNPIKISHISVHNKDSTSVSSQKFIFVDPIYKDPTSGAIMYPSIVLDSLMDINGVITDSAATTFQSSNGPGYLQIDLGNSSPIGYIQIAHNNTTDAATLVDASLTIYNLDSTDILKENAIPVFSTKISGNITNRIIYVTNNYMGSNNPVQLYKTFNYPSCIGCYDEGNNLYNNYNYTSVDGRCFKVVGNTVKTTDLNSAINKDPTLTLNNYFASCSITEDTRYSPPIGRYIRIQSNQTNASVKLTKFEVYSINATPGSTPTFVIPVDVHVKPYLSSQTTNYSVLLSQNNTIPVSTDINTTTNSYIQLDLGSNMLIKQLIITKDGTNDNTASTLKTSTLSIIKEDGSVTYQIALSVLSTLVENFNVYFN
jgi:hypothetical protein